MDTIELVCSRSVQEGVRCLSRALDGVENIIIFSARRKSNINSIWFPKGEVPRGVKYRQTCIKRELKGSWKCPLYELLPFICSSNYMHYSLKRKKETALYRQWYVIYRCPIKAGLTVKSICHVGNTILLKGRIGR